MKTTYVPDDSWWECELQTSPVFRWVYTNKNGRFYIYPKNRV